MRTQLILLLLVVYSGTLRAQKNRPDFRHEVGFDLINAVYYKGVSMLIKTSAFNPSRKNRAWRVLGTYYQENPYEYPFSYYRNDTLHEEIYGNRIKKNVFLFAGLEFSKQRKKWCFYGGPELGYQYSIYRHERTTSIKLVNPDTVLSQTLYKSTVFSNSPRISIFGGTQFFVTPHWSLGLELNMDFGLVFARTSSVSGNNEYHLSLWNFDLHPRLLRLFYISYHFGSDKVISPSEGGLR